MKILLVAPTVDTCYERVMPLGLMNLYLIGKQLGCEMELMDLSIDVYQNGLAKILSKRYDIIGISCNFTNAAPYCIRYAGAIKQKYPNTMVIAGGNHATMLPGDLLLNKYDYIIYGEGEVTFKKFLQRILTNKTVEDLEGLHYLKNGEIISTPPREPLEDMDTLPFNDYSEFDLTPYFHWAKIKYLNIETSRGCIYDCAFCATVKMWGRQFRHKSPQRIVDEFILAKRLKCEYVFLCDDDTALDEEHLNNVCRLLINKDVIIPWGTTIGSASIKNSLTVDLLKKSGCIKINICIESANPRILKAYRKKHTIEDNKKICLNLVKKGILVHNHGIIGFPDETLRETLNTYFYLIKTSPIWHITILEPRPGTDYWKTWDKKGEVSQYKLFGKANVFLAPKKISVYLIYRFFFLCYFLNPVRIWNAFLNTNRSMRYNYRIQYYVAYRTLKANILDLFRK